MMMFILAGIGATTVFLITLDSLWSSLEMITSYLMPYFQPGEVQSLTARFGSWAAVLHSIQYRSAIDSDPGLDFDAHTGPGVHRFYTWTPRTITDRRKARRNSNSQFYLTSKRLDRAQQSPQCSNVTAP
ncbi:hypothetical protein EVAR_87815_1 [Eumeta japonica]|uniref:Uncharacterized protein n=1 Tax=Eumeta variegata TaxID=151549 RepID=A0A4C1Z6M8_EUMVA|nr:hypothetical protein EVAR_87815_1 [Eumeta japonica]